MSLPGLTPDEVIKLQESDVFCKNILQHMGCSKYEGYFKDAMGVLHKKVNDFNCVCSAVVVPQILMKYLSHAPHDSLRHVAATKLYHFFEMALLFERHEKEIT